MFERFSSNLLKIVSRAQEEALGLGCSSLRPEHLLLGLVTLTDDHSAEILRSRGVTLLSVIEKLRTESEPASMEVACEVPLAESSKETFGNAYRFSSDMGSTECGTQHLLLALLKDDVVISILNRMGLSLLELETEARASNFSKPAASDSLTLKRQVEVWQNRADMARKQGNQELVHQALEQKSKYEKLLADL